MKKFLVALLFYFNTMTGSEWYAGVRILTAVDFGVFLTEEIMVFISKFFFSDVQSQGHNSSEYSSMIIQSYQVRLKSRLQ
jgi:hypothetical protein